MVTNDDYSKRRAGKNTRRWTSSRGARARDLFVRFWSGRILDQLKRKTSSYEHLTQDQHDADGNGTSFDDTQINPGNFTKRESDNLGSDHSAGSSRLLGKIVRETESVAVQYHKRNDGIDFFNMSVNQSTTDSNQVLLNVSGFAALDINSQENEASVNTSNFLETPVAQRRHTYYHDSILDLRQTTSSQQDGDVSESVAVTANNPGPGLRFDDKDWQLYYKGKKKEKEKRKKKTVIHLDTSDNNPSFQKDCYVELEEIEEGKPSKKKRKRRRVTSKKIKKGAKKAGKMAWKGTKFSWKCLKYGLIYMTEGPGAALNVRGLSHAYTPTIQRHRYGNS